MSEEKNIYQVKFIVKHLFNKNIEYYLPHDKKIKFNIDDEMFFQTLIKDKPTIPEKIELAIFVIKRPKQVNKSQVIIGTNTKDNKLENHATKSADDVNNETTEKRYEREAEYKVRKFLAFCSVMETGFNNSPVMIEMDIGGTRYVSESEIGNTYVYKDFSFGWEYEITPDRKKKKYEEFINYLNMAKGMHEISKNMTVDYYLLALDYFYRSSITDLTYTHFAVLESRFERRFVDLIMSLECLFNEGVGDISYKLSFRASFVYCLLRETESISAVKQFFSDMYKIRNKIVHGSTRPIIKSEDIKKLDDYMKIILTTYYAIIFSNKEKTQKESIVKIIDEAILEPPKRIDLINNIINLSKRP
jgi:hypothetical protein